MGAAAWPSELPTGPEVLLDGHSEVWSGHLIRTDMETGPAKLRRRTTAVTRNITCRMALDLNQVAELRRFHATTLDYGVKPFQFDLPREGGDILCRFVGDITITPMGSGELWTASFTVEKLP